MKITASFTIRYIARRPSGTWHTFEIEARARLEHDQADALDSEIKEVGYALELASPADALVWWVEKLRPMADALGAELVSVTLPDGDRSYSWP